MSSPRPRNTLTLKEKVRLLILDQKNTHSRHELAKMFGVGITQIYRIVNKGALILHLYHNNEVNDTFRRLDQLRGIKGVLDLSLLEWIKRLRNRNDHVTGKMIKKTALEIAELLGIDRFKASNGWLQGFMTRYKLSLSKYNRAGSLAPALMETWKSKIVDLINDYDLSDIYAVDETGLFFRALPSQLTEYETMRCSMGEMPADRATLLLCVSLSGDKEKPLVISSLFKELGRDNAVLPDIEFQYEERSFMTTTIMAAWLKRFDLKMGQQGRKVVLFLDHAMSHHSVVTENVTLTFVHPNFTPSWDPMEQGVFQNFKLKYRERVLEHLIENVLENEYIARMYKEIDIFKATTWITSAWEEVNTETIRNAFCKAGFPVEQDPSCDDEAANVEEIFGSTHMSRLLGILPSDMLIEEYSFIDSNLAIEAVTVDIVEIVRHFHNHLNTTSNEVEEESVTEQYGGTTGTTDGGDEERVYEKQAATFTDEYEEGNRSAEDCREELEEFLVFK